MLFKTQQQTTNGSNLHSQCSAVLPKNHNLKMRGSHSRHKNVCVPLKDAVLNIIGLLRRFKCAYFAKSLFCQLFRVHYHLDD